MVTEFPSVQGNETGCDGPGHAKSHLEFK